VGISDLPFYWCQFAVKAAPIRPVLALSKYKQNLCFSGARKNVRYARFGPGSRMNSVLRLPCIPITVTVFWFLNGGQAGRRRIGTQK
jgi:hypothetical protein